MRLKSCCTACLLTLSGVMCPVQAGDWDAMSAALAMSSPPGATHLIDITQGSVLSSQVSAFRGMSFETATGQTIRFDDWYRTRWTDLRLAWLSEVNRHWGVIWGFSTGERGQKYTIDPSLQLGLVYQTALSSGSSLSWRAVTQLGGKLREKPCVANYGDIGGIQQVNCRLAATELTPEATLAYLLHRAPPSSFALNIKFTHLF